MHFVVCFAIEFNDPVKCVMFVVPLALDSAQREVVVDLFPRSDFSTAKCDGNLLEPHFDFAFQTEFLANIYLHCSVTISDPLQQYHACYSAGSSNSLAQ